MGKPLSRWKRIYRAIALLDAQPYDIVQCQFGTIGPAALMFRKTGFLQGKL